MEWRYSCSCFSLSSLMCCWNEAGERSSFYRWRGGVYSWEHSLDPLTWKDQNCLPYIEFTNIPTWTDNVKAVRGGLWSLAPIGAIGAATTPQLGPLGPIFGWWSSLDLLSGSTWVPDKDYAIDLGLALSSSYLGPALPSCGPLFWACVEWYLCFVPLHIFSPFMCFSKNTLLQTNKHQIS
jgi:hypothetical protein